MHSGWPILRTWAVVEASWQRILAAPGRNQLILTNAPVAVDAELAQATLDEHLVEGDPGHGRCPWRPPTCSPAPIVGGGWGWRVVAHHGSPIAVA